MASRGRPTIQAIKTTGIRVNIELNSMLREIATLEGTTVAEVADRLFKQAIESELKRVRKRVMEGWAATAK